MEFVPGTALMMEQYDSLNFMECVTGNYGYTAWKP